MLILIAACFLAALAAPWLHRWCPKYTGALILAAPLAVFVWLLKHLSGVAHMIGRAAYRSGVSLWILTRIDEWKAHGALDQEDDPL